METRKLIVPAILILIIGIMLYALIALDFSYYKSNYSKNLNSNWNSSKGISRIDNSNETIAYREVDVIVKLNEKVIGDTSAADPLVIDLSKEGIIIKNGLFLKSCKVKFRKEIQQKFKVNTDLTSITTDFYGKIIYNIDYEIKGICNYDMAEKMITDRIMNDIYKEAKGKVKFGLPTILVNNLPISSTENLPDVIINKELEMNK